MHAAVSPSASTRSIFACSLFVLLFKSSIGEKNCDYGLKQLWSSSLRNSPMTATPLLFDVDGDGYKDIVTPSFSGEVWAVHGENGHIVDGWPFYLEDRGFHASPLVYDVNRDGILDFVLSTSDAEILFLQPDNTLLHGETIKLPPLRVQRHWYNMDKAYLEKIAEELSQQINNPAQFSFKQKEEAKPSHKRPLNLTTPFSEFESRYGRYSDPLHSRHQPGKRLSGLDPDDSEYIYVDPHILATPALVDTNGDGFANELVIPVSYYFDPFYYGDLHNMAQLGGLEQEELAKFTAGGIVLLDLYSGQILKHLLLGITEAGASQPGYLLATPTVVKIFPGVGDNVIIVGSAKGELHMLSAATLESYPGFPVQVDSISAQVAVADLTKNGALELVVGDNSGIVYCIDQNGKRLWEFEALEPIVASVRFADIEGDGTLEVFFVTGHGAVWALNGQTGKLFADYPIRLNTAVQTSMMLMHLNSTSRRNALSIIVPTPGTIYIIDSITHCLQSFESDMMFREFLADDVDPYSPGLELLVLSLDGFLVCFSTDTVHSSDYDMAVESWPGEAVGQTGFTHKSSSFAVILPHSNYTEREISGRSFILDFQIADNGPRSSKQYNVLVTVGRKHILYKETLPVYQRVTDYSIGVVSPPEPIHAFLTVTVCNEHNQCDSASYIVRFNLHFQDNLKWFLALPFLSLCGMLLWLIRDAGFAMLPTAHSSRKEM